MARARITRSLAGSEEEAQERLVSPFSAIVAP